ncbi:MAG: hypothetical protein LBL34_05545 [Clostridiales bacterium]|jgi:Na+/phosphate symporter|nr:hypothetical protein [Clostridiales bacterium]
MGTLDVGIVGVGAKEAIRGLLARFSSKRKLERSKEMDDVTEREPVVELDYDYKLDIAKDVLREHISSSSHACFRYVRKLGRPGDESHPILQIWAEKIHPMGELAFDCKTIEEVDAMHDQLIVYIKEAQDIYEKEAQTRGKRPTR